MRNLTWLTRAVIAAAITTAASATGAQAPARGNTVQASDSDAYSSSEADFVIGRRVYLRSTKTWIGTILLTKADKSFPTPNFPRAHMKAVLIKRFDGPLEWVPVEGITRIYVTRAR